MKSWASATRENRPETSLAKDSGNGLALISLDFDCTLFDGTTATAGSAHFLGQLFLLRQTDPDKTVDDGHRLTAPASGFPSYLHASSIFFLAWFGRAAS